jgi:hypothetical protein
MADAEALRRKCAVCGHGLSFHGGKTGIMCKAMGCRAGVDKARCPGFVAIVDKPVFGLQRALSAPR